VLLGEEGRGSKYFMECREMVGRATLGGGGASGHLKRGWGEEEVLGEERRRFNELSEELPRCLPPPVPPLLLFAHYTRTHTLFSP
jgi:hypothetical protein